MSSPAVPGGGPTVRAHEAPDDGRSQAEHATDRRDALFKERGASGLLPRVG